MCTSLFALEDTGQSLSHAFSPSLLILSLIVLIMGASQFAGHPF